MFRVFRVKFSILCGGVLTDDLAASRRRIRAASQKSEGEALRALLDAADFDSESRIAASARAAEWIRDIRARADSGIVEKMLEEYELSTKEGVALMCLAEALLRVPDADTTDSLIADKIAAANWGAHLGHSASPLVNASAWTLFLTGRLLSPDGESLTRALSRAVKRLGGPVIRAAAIRAVSLMGEQFILGKDIDSALRRAEKNGGAGYRHSYDMLGEAAMTAADARRYFAAYENAVEKIAQNDGKEGRDAAGISIKLSALHPRYEESRRRETVRALADSLIALARRAKDGGVEMTVDAEESARLDISLDIVEETMRHPALAGWDGFGIAVQAYGRRAPFVIDWLALLAKKTRRRMTVRLVKGAYWDGEIKRAQAGGFSDFPVFTRKAATDASYLACARKLLRSGGRVYPQFATHNAHTVAAVLRMAGESRGFEFQRLHGMGAALYEKVTAETGARCRIYAPVGAHRDLLAYLARRMLENGANSSFVRRIMDEKTPPETVAACPLAKTESILSSPQNPRIAPPPDLFLPRRANSRGWDLQDRDTWDAVERARAPHKNARFYAAPILAFAENKNARPPPQIAVNPADESDKVGEVHFADANECAGAAKAAKQWTASPEERARILRRAAAMLEERCGMFFALLAREAGKTPPDAVDELREAVDFLRHYAADAEESRAAPVGVFVCISPWNFPLAIFTGQIAAALAAGNAVLAKPAPQTPLVGYAAAKLFHEAGVPRNALQFLPGGKEIGAALIAAPQVGGAAFTGSTAAAKNIHRAMSRHSPPGAPLIAETGGINAMIADSTALPEQAARDVIRSAFQSAGQRCSALRVLYVQEDILPAFQTMLFGAMDELTIGDPWNMDTDIGPLIDRAAAEKIRAHIDAARQDGRALKILPSPGGLSPSPAVIRTRGVREVREEIFGPVLHLASFRAGETGAIIDAVNESGHGLTFGLHSRIDARVDEIAAKLRAGNLYVNRDQIGAVVGGQPFGGEGLSGTGPKAGGARYVRRFRAVPAPPVPFASAPDAAVSAERLDEIRASLAAEAKTPNAAPQSETLPGPVGELNLLTLSPRGKVLCLGPGESAARAQAKIAEQAGCAAILAPEGAGVDLRRLRGFAAALYWGNEGRKVAANLAAREGEIIPLLTGEDGGMLIRERHLCVDTAAAGGNAALWAQGEE
ncbi:MAG: bifunctional proline dehydrogenase/L-glutamate gamma-semialdehyde dehydrogenase PutA [Gammaproteobacteria bacterium]